MRTDPPAYRFGDFTLAPGERQLRRAEAEVSLRPKAFDTLLCLVRRHGHLVGKDDLLDAVWPETHVSEAVLTHCIAEVRKALGDEAIRPRFVRTVARAGYKFIGEVTTLGDEVDGGTSVRNPAEAGSHERTNAIAVLPFANISGDAENEYFCDGLSEELINALTRLPALKVVAHSSSFSFKGRDLDAREIGRQLSVGSILEGSVRKVGDRLRVSAQLIDTSNGYHRWSEQYDRRLEDVFAIQDEISRAILSSLQVEFNRTALPVAARRPPRDMRAYMLYLQGRAFWHKRFAGFMQRAIECFEQAIAVDPGFAPAYSGLSDSHITLAIWAFVPPEGAFSRAAALAGKALELDDALAEAHASQGMVHAFYRWDWDAAGRAFARALDLNPGSALIHLWNGHYLSIIGRFDEAIAEVRLAQALDPLSPVVSANLGWTYHLAHRQDLAIETLHEVLRAVPGNGIALFYLGYAYAEAGRHEEAMRCFQTSIEVTGGMPWLAESIGSLHGLAGRRDLALAVLRDSEARMATTYVPSSAVAIIHLGLGDDDAAFEWLGRAVEERDALMPWLKYMPLFAPLRSDPRFQDLLARIGLA